MLGLIEKSYISCRSGLFCGKWESLCISSSSECCVLGGVMVENGFSEGFVTQNSKEWISTEFVRNLRWSGLCVAIFQGMGGVPWFPYCVCQCMSCFQWVFSNFLNAFFFVLYGLERLRNPAFLSKMATLSSSVRAFLVVLLSLIIVWGAAQELHLVLYFWVSSSSTI